jgi:hypothetical protein
MKGRRYLHISAGSGVRGVGKKMVWPTGAKALARSMVSKLAPFVTPRQAHWASRVCVMVEKIFTPAFIDLERADFH